MLALYIAPKKKNERHSPFFLKAMCGAIAMFLSPSSSRVLDDGLATSEAIALLGYAFQTLEIEIAMGLAGILYFPTLDIPHHQNLTNSFWFIDFS